MFCSFTLFLFCVSLLSLLRQSEPSADAVVYCSQRSPIRRDYGRSEECGAAAGAETKTVNWFQMCSGGRRRPRRASVSDPSRSARKKNAGDASDVGKDRIPAQPPPPSLFVLGSIHALDVLNPAQSPPSPPTPPPICESMTRARSNTAVAAARRAQRGAGAQMLGRLERHIFLQQQLV